MDAPKFFLRARLKRPVAQVVIGFGLLCALGAMWAVARAQAPAKATSSSSPLFPTPVVFPQHDVPPREAPPCCGYPFPRNTDAEIADSDVHHVLYKDAHVMFLEVINPPLLDTRMHGHPYASVFAHDSNTGGHNPAAPPMPTGGYDPKLDDATPYNDMGSENGAAPAGMAWPTCTDSAPQAPHRPFNANLAPNHFYRLEFLRLDGDDLAKHWREWYPELAQPGKPVKDLSPGPALGPKFSEQWPYPIAYDAIQAAPANYKLLFEDGKMRLIEVSIRPGETTPMHGSPYPAVLAFNTITNSADITDTKLDPASPLNGQGSGWGKAPHLYNLKVPLCETMTARAPHAIHNGGATPLHYYQIEYKRIDGDGLVANWRKWYPYMEYMPFMR
jgi:hypothetical protein